MSIAAGTTALISSCDLVKDFTYNVNPNPLEMHGDNVKFSVVVNVPEKGISKKVKAEITPKLGSTAIGTWVIQGEKITGNGQTITFKPGGSATFDLEIPYSSDMEAADLKVTGKVFKGTKEKEDIPETKIADGTVITPLMVRKDFKVIFEKDAIIRETVKSTAAVINFDKSKSDVKATEMKDKDIADLLVWLKTSESNPKIQITSIDIKGFASPDGVEDKNTNLSNERTRAARKAIVDLMKKSNMLNWADTTKYIVEGKGEDFDGFKNQLALTTTINEADKNLFIRILEMTKDPVQREKDMVNLGKSYTELEKDVFPKIRRAVITINYKELGLTDDEIMAAAKNNPASLGIEELLFAGARVTDLNEKAAIYQAATQNHSSDFRGHNNLGAVQFTQNKVADAKSSLEKANSLKDNSTSKNNLAGVAISEGDRVNARKLLNQSKGNSLDAGNVVYGYNSAALDILDGNYASAESNSKENSFNKALAYVLQNKLAEAKTALANITGADVDYLKAIIASRGGEGSDAVVNNLKNAFAKDGLLKTKAAKDREFVKLFADSNFSSAVR
jgi:outer membrane protein OmpA-like peptidoglycan-associated protein/Flp pilus assembly protein TadD